MGPDVFTRMRIHFVRLVVTIFIFNDAIQLCSTGNPDAKRLFEDLISGYNKLIRPVPKNSDLLEVRFKLRLSQLLDVEWNDYKLLWTPSSYGNVTVLYVPGTMIWLPDIVLYNNADGNYQVTIMTKATVRFDGKVTWEPPAIYKSMCQIDVEWFPFDEQKCEMKFGSWTYDGTQVDLKHLANETNIVTSQMRISENQSKEIACIEEGIDLTEYYQSTEWDIIAVPGIKKKEWYPCCPTPYVDITYNIYLRRKTLFYTVNLIVPCVGISFLTVLVFYLPSDSGEKVTLSISILISLTVFFLLLVEIIPSTSLVIPLIGKYLLFTMVLVTLSICVTVIVINFHFRSPRTHKMSAWMRKWFLMVLPKYLFIERPRETDLQQEYARSCAANGPSMPKNRKNSRSHKPPPNYYTFANPYARDGSLKSNQSGEIPTYAPPGPDCYSTSNSAPANNVKDRAQSPPTPLDEQIKRLRQGPLNPELQKAIEGVQYIATHLQKQQMDEKVMEDWKFVAMVIDRLFLWLFCLVCLIGTLSIICQAPTLWDNRPAIDDPNLVIPLADRKKYC